MNLVTKFVLVMALFTSAVVPTVTFAATEAGLTPKSPFYFLDKLSEGVSLFFTFSPEKKAKKALEYANERLAEAEVVAEEKNPDAVKMALTNYESNVALATEKSKQIKDEKKAEVLLTSIADNNSKNQEILTNILTKVPDEAKEAITKAIEASKKGQDEALKQIAELNKEIVGLKQEIAKLKSENKQTKLELQKTNVSIQKSSKVLSNKEVISKVKPAVVYIETNEGKGSGMIMESDGFILTNAHVVNNVNSVQVKLSDNRLFIGVVIGRDENIDLAIIKIDNNNLPVVELGNSDVTEQGDEVFTLGYPFGLEGDVSFKEGTISRRIENYFEISAEIHPGNSGGPLVNRYGQVIGINTAIFGKSISGIQLGETIKLVIPINTAKNIIPDLKAGKVVIDEVAQAKEAAAKAKDAEEKRKIEEVEREAERMAAEERKRIEEENKRIEAEILVAQQCKQNKQAIVTEYNDKELDLEQQITNRKSKYYADYAALTESFRGRGITVSIAQRQYDALLREVNADIDRLNLELDKLYVEYSSKLNQFQC